MSNKCDTDLVHFLCDGDPIILVTISKMLNTWADIEVRELQQYKSEHDITSLSPEKRAELAAKIVKLIRYFGSNDISYSARSIAGIFTNIEPGVSYDEVLRDALKTIKKLIKNKTQIPRVASIEEKERLICEMILQSSLEGKTAEEIAQMFIEAGLDEEASISAAKKIGEIGTSGGGVILLVRLLGKRAVKEIINQFIVKIVTKRLGREAAEKIAEQVLKKTAQKTIAKLVSGVGWALIIFDVITVFGPANRIIIPTIAFIACVRTADKLDG